MLGHTTNNWRWITSAVKMASFLAYNHITWTDPGKLKQKTLVGAEVTANRAKWESCEGKIKGE